MALREELERRFVTVEEVLTIADREITIVRPRSAEDLINEEDFAHDERLPYWADIWPSATILAAYVLEQTRPATRVVELGCGVGVVTVAAMLAGHDVLATDYYPDALAFTRLNARINTKREPRVQHVDWRALPSDLDRVPLLLASDVLYEREYAPLIAEAIARIVEPEGRAVVADPGRAATEEFLEQCALRELHVIDSDARDFRAGEIRQTITLYTLAPSAASSRAFTSIPHR